METATWALFRWPELWIGRFPQRVEGLLRNYHGSFLRGSPIQYRSDCSEPAPGLLYRLRVGRCRFATDEFDTTVRVSRRHLREDFETTEPDFVVLGDSYSMGWGVEREAAYPALVARRTGLREVVVANSSYGTVRELLLLREAALVDFQAIVLQYCANDIYENRAFLRAGRHLSSPAWEYSDQLKVWEQVSQRNYLRRSRAWLSMFWWTLRAATESAEAVPAGNVQAKILIDVLESFAADLRGRPLVVFGADLERDNASFIRAFNEAPKVAALARAKAFDATNGLQASDLYRLDPHWRDSGHRVVSAAVLRALAEVAPELGLYLSKR
jgi:hypothetical protein